MNGRQHFGQFIGWEAEPQKRREVILLSIGWAISLGSIFLPWVSEDGRLVLGIQTPMTWQPLGLLILFALLQGPPSRTPGHELLKTIIALYCLAVGIATLAGVGIQYGPGPRWFGRYKILGYDARSWGPAIYILGTASLTALSSARVFRQWKAKSFAFPPNASRLDRIAKLAFLLGLGVTFLSFFTQIGIVPVFLTVIDIWPYYTTTIIGPVFLILLGVPFAAELTSVSRHGASPILKFLFLGAAIGVQTLFGDLFFLLLAKFWGMSIFVGGQLVAIIAAVISLIARIMVRRQRNRGLHSSA